MIDQLSRIARRQAGCFSIRQALQCGYPSYLVDQRVFDGEWLHVMGDVLVVAGAPVTEAMKAWTAVLAIGQPVALAAQTAGRWVGLERVPEPERPQLVVPNSRRPRDITGLDVHRVVEARWAVVWHRRLPVTPINLTLRDMGRDLPRDQLSDVVQHALRRRRTSCEALTKMLGRGRPGAAGLRRVLEEVGPGFQVKWERMVHKAVLRRGVRMSPQTEVVAPDGRKAYLDLGIEELKFGVEIDGFLNHMARFRADRRRARMLAAELDWTLAPFAADEVANNVEAVADEIVWYVRRLQAAAA